MTTTPAWSGDERLSDAVVRRDVVSRDEDHLALSDLRGEPVNSVCVQESVVVNTDVARNVFDLSCVLACRSLIHSVSGKIILH